MNRKLIALSLLLPAFIAGRAFGDTAVVEGVTWYYQLLADGASVVEGEIPYTGDVVIPAKLGGADVVELAASSFHNSAELKSVYIPDSVMRIGGWAFDHCTGLETVRFPPRLEELGNSAFSHCSSMANTAFPAGITRLDIDMCYEWFKLTEMTIPEGVASMGHSAFFGCTALKQVVFPASFTTFDYVGYSSEYSMQFGRCTALEKAIFKGRVPTNLMKSGLQYYGKIYYPKAHAAEWEAVVTAAKFGGYTDDVLKDSDPEGPVDRSEVVNGVTWYYRLEDGVATILEGEVAYTGDLVIPAKLGGADVVAVGQAAFHYGDGLKSVYIPDSVTRIGWWAFDHCADLESVRFPPRLEELGNSAFSHCGSMTNTTFPAGITRLDIDICYGWSKLTEMTIPEGVASMGRSAFYGCTSLKKVVFPASFKSFDYTSEMETNMQFGRCTALEEAIFNGPVPANLMKSGLQYYGKIYYPKAYATGWEQVVSAAKFGGYTDDIGKEPEPVPPSADGSVVTNFVYVTVTNVVEHHHYTTVTNVVEHHHYTTVSNVVEYVPAPGTSPAPAYPAQAGGAFSQVVAGAAGWDVLELPEGMTWDSATGTLGGTPVRSGTYDLILVSGSGADTKMMRTTVEVAGFEPIVGYVGTAFAWMGAPVTLFADYKGLPAGLKWSAAAGTLAGVPTKAGDFSRATTYGDAVSFTVLDLPATAVGTFNGLVSLDGTNYPVLVTTTKAGKLTAKIALGAKTLSLPAASWGGWKREGGRLLFTATCASKTDAVELSLDADADWDADQMAVSVTAGVLAGATGSAQRADFASGAAQAAAVAVAGSYTFDCEAVAGGYRLMAPEGGKVGAMAVVLKPNGAATLKGKYDGKTAVSASATLHMDGEGMRSLTFFYKGMQFTWEW